MSEEGGCKVTVRSPLGETTMFLRTTEEALYAGLAQMQTGKFVQDAFPRLNADEREFLISGMTPEKWEETFGPEE